MPIKIKNWKLAILALLFFCLFLRLGMWQVARAKQKTVLLSSFHARTEQTPLTPSDFKKIKDPRFYRAELTGNFDNEHNLLLDNKIFHGKVGYEIYTPFYAEGLTAPILIDRGFVAMGASRKEIPAIRNVHQKVTLVGLINLPPTYVAFGEIADSSQIVWPLRVEYINLGELSRFVPPNHKLFPYILQLRPEDPAAYPLEWQVVTMSPEKHMGYAVQWFALALTLLILFVALNRDKQKGG